VIGEEKKRVFQAGVQRETRESGGKKGTGAQLIKER